jgi:ferredoxin
MPSRMTGAHGPGTAPATGTPPARLQLNPITCTGHGSCADLLPELISLDEWGYPLLADGPVPPELTRRARRAVRDCPMLALRLAADPEPGRP